MKNLKEKTAFIAGGANGIGLALAEALGRQGVAICIADIDDAALATAAAVLKDSVPASCGVRADVTRRSSLEEAARHCVAQFGKIHLLVNAANASAFADFGALPPGEWNRLIEVNIKGVVNGVESIVPLMLKHGEGGHVVNIASIAGFQTRPGLEAYASTKAAVIGMSEAWRIQLAGTGVSVSVVCPGIVQTDAAMSGHGSGSSGSKTIAARIVEGVMADELHIFTHIDYRAEVEARLDDLLNAFDCVDRSPVLREEANA